MATTADYTDVETNNDIQELKRLFMEFLDSEEIPGDYSTRIRDLINSKQTRLTVDLNHLRQFDSGMTQSLMRRPNIYIIALQEAVKEVAQNLDPSFGKFLSKNEMKVGFEGSFGHNHVSPRELTSKYICNLVCVEGIVTKCSLVRPKVVKSVHYCPATAKFSEREYRDSTDLSIGVNTGQGPKLPTPAIYPTVDVNNNPLETEYGLCHFKDHQTVTIQEMPERAPLGQLPRSVDLILDDDLVDAAKPGDRVQVVGVYRALGGVQQGQAGAAFRTLVLANRVRVLGRAEAQLTLTDADVRNIRELAAQEGDVLGVLARSFAPGIYGHEAIKRGLVLQLLGGVEKNLDNGTHLRGDINLMMVGDPSCGKSQLLRQVLKVAPLAINTTACGVMACLAEYTSLHGRCFSSESIRGRGSSGVGLTAAVTTDPETKERRLEAGAMVLADRGVVCIDEFDKMSDQDRVAIHEVMEQQTVTIAKAGIHASLNARCAVAAAANPIYGGYDRSRRPQENIGLPDSLLSRFDLLFIVLDALDARRDRQVAAHVLRAHRYRRPGLDGARPEPLATGAMDLLEETAGAGGPRAETPVWERYNPLLHGAAGSREDEEVLSQEFLKKYLHYAKARVVPELGEGASDALAEAYADLRGKQGDGGRNLPVTARSLETIIRLATATAKARLSSSVEDRDIAAAVELINYAMFHETAEHAPPPGGGGGSGGGGGGGGGGSGGGGGAEETKDRDGEEEEEGRPRRRQRREAGGGGGEAAAAKGGNEGNVDPSSERYSTFSGLLVNLRPTDDEEDKLHLDVILDKVNASQANRYTRGEAVQMLKLLEQENKLMFREEESCVYWL